MTSINIHDVHEIVPEVHHSSDGRGWITLKLKRKHWRDENTLEEAEVTMFTDDILMVADGLAWELRQQSAKNLSHLSKREEENKKFA
ncbi:MAG: hypothetical protein ACO20Y_08865 [Poseidonia sp.]